MVNRDQKMARSRVTGHFLASIYPLTSSRENPDFFSVFWPASRFKKGKTSPLPPHPVMRDGIFERPLTPSNGKLPSNLTSEKDSTHKIGLETLSESL